LFGPEIADTTFNGYRVSTELSGYILLCSAEKKDTHTALEQLEEKMMTEFLFLG